MPYWLVQTGAGPGIDGGLVLRRGATPADGQAVNAYVITMDAASCDASTATALAQGGSLALPKMAIPGVGWLAYCKDTEGDIIGLMQADTAAG